MKSLYKIVLLATMSILLAGCGKNEPRNRVDLMTEKVSIRPAEGVKLRADNSAHLSALEIVKQADGMKLMTPNKGGLSRRWADAQKDLTPDAPRLMMWGIDILHKIGPADDDLELELDFLDATEVRIIKADGDVIAYIPNNTIKSAYEQIKSAFDKKDFETVKKLFDTAYRFTPISDKEWKELKAKGQL